MLVMLWEKSCQLTIPHASLLRLFTPCAFPLESPLLCRWADIPAGLRYKRLPASIGPPRLFQVRHVEQPRPKRTARTIVEDGKGACHDLSTNRVTPLATTLDDSRATRWMMKTPTVQTQPGTTQHPAQIPQAGQRWGNALSRSPLRRPRRLCGAAEGGAGQADSVFDKTALKGPPVCRPAQLRCQSGAKISLKKA